MKTLLYIILFVFINSPSFGQNENISQGSIFDGEPNMVINPNNSQHIVVAWMGYKLLTDLSITTKVSFDGGTSWSTANSIPHVLNVYRSADPTLAFDNQGNLFLTYIDFLADFSLGAIYSVKSTDGGLTWSTPSKVIDVFDDGNKKPVDRPWMVIDTSVSTNQPMYITSMNRSKIAPPNHPYLSKSFDQGVTWQSWRYADTASWLAGSLIPQPLPSLAVGSDGTLYITYPSYVPSQNVYPQYILAKSSDNGNSFTWSTLIDGLIVSTPDTMSKKTVLLITDPSDVDHLAFIFLSNLYGDMDVNFMESNDKGISWSTPIRINDDPIGNNRMQDMAWASFDNDGDLIISWRDRRNSDDSTFTTASQFYGAVLWNDSTSFSPNFIITDTVAYDSTLSQPGNDWMGIQMIDDTISVVWGDTKNGFLNIWFKRMANDGTILTLNELTSGTSLSVEVFPNPSNSNFTIKGANIMQIEVCSQKGKTITTKKYNEKSDSQTISLSDFSTGMYFLIIQTKDGFVTKKVIKE